jgi:hypothetical protein
MSATSPYAMRVMQDTPNYVTNNDPVATLAKVEREQGWDTPVSGDMLAASTTYVDHPTDNTMALATTVLPLLTRAQVTALITNSNATKREEHDPDYASEREHMDTHRRRFAIGAILPRWGTLGHHVTYVNPDGDVFDHYPSDPYSVVTYIGKQVTA